VIYPNSDAPFSVNKKSEACQPQPSLLVFVLAIEAYDLVLCLALTPVQYIENHMAEWKELEEKHGLQPGYAGANTKVAAGFQHFIMALLDFDRQMDTTKFHGAWGKSTIQLGEKESW
jgi:hypothetical protein